MKLFLIFIFLFSFGQAFAQKNCGRVAIINYQEVLVDTNSTQKGEGLRFYLERDPKAVAALNKYQEGSQIHWENAALGTISTSMILAGLISNKSDDTKKSLLVGGASLMAVNFLIIMTLSNNNESNLENAIKEYNKRNLPKIHFNPISFKKRDASTSAPYFVISKSWNF